MHLVQNPFKDPETMALRRALETARRNMQDLISIGRFLRRERIKFEQTIQVPMRVCDLKYKEALNVFKYVDGYFQSSQSDKAWRRKENKRLQAELDKVTIEEERGRIARELQQLQQKCARQEAEIVKKDKRTLCFRRELIAATKEHLQTLTAMRRKEDEGEERERWWRKKCEELEVRL